MQVGGNANAVSDRSLECFQSLASQVGGNASAVSDCSLECFHSMAKVKLEAVPVLWVTVL